MSLPRLFDFAYVPSAQIQELVELAEPEDWNYRQTPSDRPYPILHNYLMHTFMRCYEEGKVLILEDCACFNTGLVTPHQEQIYAFFVRNRNPNQQEWFLESWCKESDRRLLEFDHLPELAHYFENPADLLYDTRLPLRKNLDHIIDDNRDRFPKELQAGISTYELRTRLSGVIDETLKRLERNYKTAIPHYYRPKLPTGQYGKGHLQLLLPLCFRSPNQADLALAVYRQNDVYLAATILTLDMAYNNARLIARPDTQWLAP
jgi:hypothetical protein